MKSIILILPYFGKWPIWFEAHLVSIAQNPTINWLVVTDCEIPKHFPQNIKFVKITLEELNEKVNAVVGANVPLTPRKFCDLKPAYGDIFSEYINSYDFWGFCDMDIIWGDIRKFMTSEILDNYDIISSRKEAISGHFNLFKNTVLLNTFYKEIPNYKTLFEEPKFMWFDEQIVTNYIKNNIKKNNFRYIIYWKEILLNQERGRDSHQEYHLDRWQWANGKMINTKTNEEVMYLHFINWKRTLVKSEVCHYCEETKEFYISYSKFHFKKHNTFKIIKNDFKNIFFGYYVRMYKKKIKKRVRKYFKKFK